jgi:hypothetical protein
LHRLETEDHDLKHLRVFGSQLLQISWHMSHVFKTCLKNGSSVGVHSVVISFLEHLVYKSHKDWTVSSFTELSESDYQKRIVIRVVVEFSDNNLAEDQDSLFHYLSLGSIGTQNEWTLAH